MKKLLVALFLCFAQLTFAVETCDNSKGSGNQDSLDELIDEPQSLNDDERWMIDLNKHLMNHDDINISIKALGAINDAYGYRKNPETQQPLLTAEEKLALLKKVADRFDASSETMLSAITMCDQLEESQLCQIDKIKDKLFEIDSENINIYLKDLAKAVRGDDTEMVELIINRISEAKFSHIPMNLTPEFIKALDEYIEEHPYPEQMTQVELAEFDLDTTEIDMDEWNRQMIMMMYKTLSFSNFPELRPLIQACTEYQSHSDNCLVIAKTLQNNSNTMLMEMLGYSFEEKIHQQFGDDKASEQAKMASEAYHEYRSCLNANQVEHQTMDYLTDINIQKMMNESDHEGKAFEQAAVYLYEKFKKAGMENLTDPKTCGLRHIQ